MLAGDHAGGYAAIPWAMSVWCVGNNFRIAQQSVVTSGFGNRYDEVRRQVRRLAASRGCQGEVAAMVSVFF